MNRRHLLELGPSSKRPTICAVLEVTDEGSCWLCYCSGAIRYALPVLAGSDYATLNGKWASKRMLFSTISMSVSSSYLYRNALLGGVNTVVSNAPILQRYLQDFQRSTLEIITGEVHARCFKPVETQCWIGLVFSTRQR